MNYELLLKKYIKFVGEEEGVTFIDNWRRPTKSNRFRGMKNLEFTDEEWMALNRLDREIADE